MGWVWKSLLAPLLRALLCGAINDDCPDSDDNGDIDDGANFDKLPSSDGLWSAGILKG